MKRGRFVWRAETGYFLAGWNGRPWTLTVQWCASRYANLMFAAPVLGDVVVGWESKAWRNHLLVRRSTAPHPIHVTRTSWAEIDRRERTAVKRRPRPLTARPARHHPAASTEESTK